MGSVFYLKGQEKVRPGVSQRYEAPTSALYFGAPEGIVACALASDWGPIGQVCTINTHGEATALYGSKIDVIHEAIDGGATVYAVRVGNAESGAASFAEIADATSVAAANVTAKYKGARAYSYAVRKVLGSEIRKEFLLYDDGRVLEAITFDGGAGVELDALISASAASQYVIVEKKSGYSGSGQIGLKSSTPMTTGTDPQVTNADYSAGLTALEPYPFNCLICDSADPGVHTLMQAFINRALADGKSSMAVIGEPVSIPLETRMTRAMSYNDYQIVYVGGGWYDSSNVLHDGYRAAARIAGMIASTPTNEAITHKPISGAARPAELLTIAQCEKAIEKGMLALTYSPTNAVWLDSGITTMTMPTGNNDNGFKKIKRTRVRFEVMDRIHAAVAPLIGTVPSNEDGRAAVLQRGQSVLNAMISEVKLAAGAEMTLDSENPPKDDSAWFVIAIQDIDALEKIYLLYSIGGLTQTE